MIKTTTRQTIFLPMVGLVDPEDLEPGDVVGVNKDSKLIVEKLPTQLDGRVKAVEVEERPTEKCEDIGGLDEQKKELIEAIVDPITKKEQFEKIGVKPPKGVLMYGETGHGENPAPRKPKPRC